MLACVLAHAGCALQLIVQVSAWKGENAGVCVGGGGGGGCAGFNPSVNICRNKWLVY